jgi:peroxiredoxin
MLLVCGLTATALGEGVGEKVADFMLRDTRGVEHRLSSITDAKAIVLAFNGIGCPIAELYAPKLQRIAEAYADKGVRVLGVNANRQDDIQELRAYVNRHGITFPVLKDHHHVLADQLGAERTTEIFLLDASRVLRFRGRLDDQYGLTERSVGTKKDFAETHYLVDAIEALLAGREIAIKQVAAAGCVIGRERKITDDKAVTYYGQVEPIVQRRCQTCHRPGEIGPFSLLDYDDVSGWSGMIREVVTNRRMPPWHADPEIGAFANDRSLTQTELDTLVRWIDNGTPAGDPADQLPPVEFPKGWSIGEPDVVLEMSESFDVPAEGVVDYQWFKVKTKFKEDRWVQAMEIRPGVRSVVHHILVFAVDPKHPKRWQEETRGGERGFFAGMVPGGEAIRFADGTAKRLPAGATLMFQVHYTPTGSEKEDRSKIGLIFAKGPVKHEVHTRSAYNRRSLRIPPNTADKQVLAGYRFRRDVWLLRLMPHMHLRGEAFRYEAHYPSRVNVSAEPAWEQLPVEVIKRLSYNGADGTLEHLGEMTADVYDRLAALYEDPADKAAIAQLRKQSRTEVLLSVPAYDFGWQGSYAFKTPKLMPAGTLLLADARFNNSASNPSLTKEMWTQSVRWGEQTFDEMLIGYFDFMDAEGVDVPPAQGSALE